MIEVEVSKEDLDKLKNLDEFDDQNNILETSAAQYIQFKVQPERRKREGLTSISPLSYY